MSPTLSPGRCARVWGKYIAILRNVKRREASQWKYQLLRAHPENQKKCVGL